MTWGAIDGRILVLIALGVAVWWMLVCYGAAVNDESPAHDEDPIHIPRRWR